ncbi:MAG: toxin-antitoxin system, antitoxin component [Nitrospirae bacterium]|nr:toxin-antitoxin system, antitoxin component [Nitrospirota bacterium]
MQGRIQVVLEGALYRTVRKRAIATGSSLSMTVRDLVRKGLEIEEDIMLSRVAEARWRSLKRSKAIPHAVVKRRLGM